MYEDDDTLLTALESPDIQHFLPTKEGPNPLRPDRWRAWKILGGTTLLLVMALQWAKRRPDRRPPA